ncbi:hypothetical protein GCM10022293_48160 [Azospirillum formosense]
MPQRLLLSVVVVMRRSREVMEPAWAGVLAGRIPRMLRSLQSAPATYRQGAGAFVVGARRICGGCRRGIGRQQTRI